MAIQIIGSSTPRDASPEILPRAEWTGPAPSSAPAATPVHDDAWLAARAAHAEPRVRELAVARIEQLAPDSPLRSLLSSMVSDPAPEVAAQVLESLALRPDLAAIDAVAARLTDPDPRVGSAAARALSAAEPERIKLEWKRAGRLAEPVYGRLLVTIAHASENPAIFAELSRALDRAGMLSFSRRILLYAATFLSGRAELAARVVAVALGESGDEGAPEDPRPARAALLSLVGAPAELSAPAAGGELAEFVERGAGEWAALESAVDAEAIRGALRDHSGADVLRALDPVTRREALPTEPAETHAVVRRYRAALASVLQLRDRVSTLDWPLQGPFIVAALAVADLVVAATRDPADGSGLVKLARLLSVETSYLAGEHAEELAVRLSAAGERTLRQAAGLLGREPPPNVRVIERLLEALVRAGGAEFVFDAGVSAGGDHARLTRRVLAKHPALAEPVIVQVLDERPLVPARVSLALEIAGRIGTERAVLAIGRRFYELREVARVTLCDACWRLGDVRLLPLIESRTYPREPEQLVFAVLSLLDGRPAEGVVQEALVASSRERDLDERDQLAVPLRCARCHETLIYRFARAYVDPKGKENQPDPAFVGDQVCKACGVEDRLESTPDTTRRLYMELAESYRLLDVTDGIDDWRVVPRAVEWNNEEVGLARALRAADDAVKASPESLRGRLRRGRLLVTLRRSRAEADARAVLDRDPRSPEGLMLLGSVLAARGDLAGAAASFVDAHARLAGEAEPRLYVDERAEALDEAEDALLELRVQGAEVPTTVDLRNAQRRVELRDEAQRARRDAVRQSFAREG